MERNNQIALLYWDLNLFVFHKIKYLYATDENYWCVPEQLVAEKLYY